MREIKFRGKSVMDGRWVYGFFMKNENVYLIKEIGVARFVTVNTDTIGQFTGLTDCKNREIYEGDIIISKNGMKHLISYNDKQGAFLAYVVINGKKEDAQNACQWWIDKHKRRVIGNIYDNPELISGLSIMK